MGELRKNPSVEAAQRGVAKQRLWRGTEEGKLYFRKKANEYSGRNREALRMAAKAHYAQQQVVIKARRAYLRTVAEAPGSPLAYKAWHQRYQQQQKRQPRKKLGRS